MEDTKPVTVRNLSELAKLRELRWLAPIGGVSGRLALDFAGLDPALPLPALGQEIELGIVDGEIFGLANHEDQLYLTRQAAARVLLEDITPATVVLDDDGQEE